MPDNLAIFDLHCDLLSYLARYPKANPNDLDIGCALPYLQAGNVKAQVLAIFTDGSPESTVFAEKQVQAYEMLLENYFDVVQAFEGPNSFQIDAPKVALVLAIENASGFIKADEPLDQGLERLEAFLNRGHRVLYISFTHHKENRFGGGNQSQAGLKEDGKVLLEYLSGKPIAIDLSHTSDSLAQGILEFTAQKNLKLPIIASHSNFRPLCNHPRNLPLEFVQEILLRGGLIGMNFLRAYLDPIRPESLQEHIEYGFQQGANQALCFGADYFYIHDHPDQSRRPFYFPEHQDARAYPQILDLLQAKLGHSSNLENLAYKNVLAFIERNWEIR